MVSIANSASNSSAIDALTAQARSGSSSAAPSSAASPASGANQAPASRGPAVLVTLSLQLGPGPSDDVAQTLADQAQKNTDALATLDQNDKSKAEQNKAEAKEKLEQARKKLQTLQIMGGDPETIAKQAKAIGKEIKDAASEYTAALKAEMGGNPIVGGAQAVVDPTAPGTDTDTADAAAADSATATRVAGTAPTADAAPADAAATPRTAVQAYQSAADRAAANARFDPVEENVLASFKGAAHDVKAVMEAAARQLKARDPTAAHSGANTEAEMDKAIQDLTDTIRTKERGGDVDISAASDAPAAAPALDIQA